MTIGKVSAVLNFTHSTSANVRICQPEFKRRREGCEPRIAAQVNECVCKIISCMHNSLLVPDFQSRHREIMLICTSATTEIPLQRQTGISVKYIHRISPGSFEESDNISLVPVGT